MSAIKKAIRKAGGVSKLAKSLKVKPQVVNNWRYRESVPPDQCLAIERATDGQVTCHDLRPDVFPKPAEQAAA